MTAMVGVEAWIRGVRSRLVLILLLAGFLLLVTWVSWLWIWFRFVNVGRFVRRLAFVVSRHAVGCLTILGRKVNQTAFAGGRGSGTIELKMICQYQRLDETGVTYYM